MFGSYEDIKQMMNQMRDLMRQLDAYKDKPLNKEASDELMKQFRALESGIAFFQQFSEDMIKQSGISEGELAAQMKKDFSGKEKKKRSVADDILEEADQIRCEMLVNRAQFIKEQFKEILKQSQPYGQGPKGKTAKKAVREKQKKKVKKKFKRMHERMKWKKM